MDYWVMIVIAYYMIICIPLFFLGRKAKYRFSFIALIPLVNLLMLMKLLNRPLWGGIKLVIPFINILFVIVDFAALMKAYKRGEATWLIFVISILITLVIPFDYIRFIPVACGYLLFLTCCILNNERFGAYIGYYM